MCQNSISKLFKRPWCLSVLQEVVSNRISRNFGEQEVLNKLSSWAAFDFNAARHRIISTSGKLVWLTPRSDSRATTPANWIRFGVLIASWPNFGMMGFAWHKSTMTYYPDIPICVFVRECGKICQKVEASYGLQINQRTALYENHRLLPFRLKVPWHQAILPTFEGSNVGRRDLCGCSSPTLGLWPSCSTSILGFQLCCAHGIWLQNDCTWLRVLRQCFMPAMWMTRRVWIKLSTCFSARPKCLKGVRSVRNEDEYMCQHVNVLCRIRKFKDQTLPLGTVSREFLTWIILWRQFLMILLSFDLEADSLVPRLHIFSKPARHS